MTACPFFGRAGFLLGLFGQVIEFLDIFGQFSRARALRFLIFLFGDFLQARRLGFVLFKAFGQLERVDLPRRCHAGTAHGFGIFERRLLLL